MNAIEFEGHINQEGKLEIELPTPLPPGKVRVRIERIEEPLSEEEAARLMRTHPASGAEIVASEAVGGWAELGIKDGQTWVEALRKQRKERRRW